MIKWKISKSVYLMLQDVVVVDISVLKPLLWNVYDHLENVPSV